MTKQELHKAIRAGGSAIEYCMVRVICRPRHLNATDEAELTELTALLRSYTKLMEKHMKYKMVANAANDAKGTEL